MSVDTNKALARRYNKEIDTDGNLALVDELFAANYVLHMPGLPPIDREGYKQMIAMFRAAFPDLVVTTDAQVAEGDRVVNRWTTRGTHRGEFMGIPATGKMVMFTGMNILRFENGKITEHWGLFDMPGIIQQLRAVPTPVGI
jgi:steroid delta-isomerase-like uncharacterized protein